LIEDLDLSLEEKFIIAGSPASVANTFAEKCTYQFSKALSLKTVCRINQHVDIPVHIDKGAHQLKLLEARHKVVLLYLWLSYRFSDIYTDVASATQLKNQLEVLIQEGLARIRDDSDKKKDGPRTPNKQVGRDRFATKSTIEY
jgi:ATP-dependent RNA helicase SUPV3L1/SUV3